MTNFIVFGKPRAFESYEFVFDGDTPSIENAHHEPILKPKRYEEPVLHYFAREGFVGLEYYTRAKGVESERDGIVFGVAIKSASDFSITDTVSRVLHPYWNDFASALLDGGGRFVESSIINQLNNTQWSQSEIDKIQSTSLSNSVKKPQKNNILLLETPKFEDISLVESVVKEYSDVYLSRNSDIFKDPINDIVLKEANNQIYQIQGGKIESLVTARPPKKPQPITRLPIWPNGSSETNNNTRRSIFKRVLFAFVFVVLVIILICFWPNVDGNMTNGGEITKASDTIGGKAVSVDDNIESAGTINAKEVTLAYCPRPIQHTFKLDPEIKPTNCSDVPSDIKFDISDKSLAHINEKYELVVDNRPMEDTDITVNAYIRNVLLGKQHYTIAKAEQPTSVPNQGKHIPPFQGKERSRDDFLNDLRKSLDTSPEWVKNECQKMINGEYGDEYEMDAQAILLIRDEAEQRIKANKAAKSSF